MKSFNRNVIIRCTAVVSGKSKDFTSFQTASKSTGIGVTILKKIARSEYPTNLVKGKKDILFEIDVIKEVVATLTPAWETDIPTQEFLSHYKAYNFLGVCSTTYYNRVRMQPIGEPCSKPIYDRYKRPWILVAYKTSEFVANKSKEGGDN